mgnify:FL=1
MGLSIHYQGRIKDNALIDEMTEEVADVCNSMGWKYHLMEVVDTEKPESNTHHIRYSPEDVKGITFSPEECEPVILTFLPDGMLVNWVKLIHYDHLTNDLAIEWVHTKTQFAGPDTHIAVVKLLHYISEKYFSFFELSDEGLYWGTWDEKILLSQFAKYNSLLDKMTAALQNVKLAPGETVENLADRIEEILKKKFDEGHFKEEE